MTVYDKLPRPTGFFLTPEQLRVYMKCNGVRPLDEVVAQTGIARDAVLATAQALQALGLLRALSDQATVPSEGVLPAERQPLLAATVVSPVAAPAAALVSVPIPALTSGPVPVGARAMDHDRIWQATLEVYDQRLGRAARPALEKLKKDLKNLDPAATLDGVKKRLSLAFGSGAVALFEETLGDEQ